MTTIKILIYTDSPNIASTSDDSGLGVSMLKRLLETKTLALADFTVDVINRYPPLPLLPVQKLTDQLLAPYHEVWLFGYWQANVATPFNPMFFGGPDNELDQDELNVLERFMASKGLLIAGDHSEYAPGGDPNDIETFLCLGSALGQHVTRAGELRKWKGPPTNQGGSSFNTLVRTPAGGGTELDDVPQTITLLPFEQDGSPHRIFLGTNQTIKILPDHGHEGQLLIPTIELNEKWPARPDGSKPAPVFIANGCDKHSGESRPVLMIYDGDEVGVGRIVADSSWHHYMNNNLRGFVDTSPDQPLDLFKQLFHNIALYLAPLSLRQTMAKEMFDFLLRHPEVQEERGNAHHEVGRVALRKLLPISTGCEIEELLRVALPPDAVISRENFASLERRGPSVFPTRDVAIGAIINRFYLEASERLRISANAAAAAAAAAALASIPPPLTHEQIIAAGVQDAFDAHVESLKKVLSGSPALASRLP